MKNVIIVLADGFEQCEALVPHDLLKRAGADVKTVSLGAEKTVISTHGVAVRADITADELPDADKTDLLVLPGGMPGASNIERSFAICDFTRNVYGFGGHVAAICAAPYVLGKLGLLNGKRATCYPGFEKYLTGASVADTSHGGLVITDGNITTASGMGVALQFGAELVTVLYGKKAAEKILKGIMIS